MSPNNTPAEPPAKKLKTESAGDDERPQDHAHKQDKNFTKKEDGTLDDFPHMLPYENKDPNFEVKYKAHCHCGAVRYEVNSEPVSSVCCHCDTCRVTHGATSQRAILFKKDMVRFDPDSFDSLAFYQTHDKKVGRHLPAKLRCKTCGSPIADEGRNMMLCYPALFVHPDDQEPESWQPTDHIFYKQAKLSIERKDGVNFWEGAKEKSEKM
ncbi:hypothetical protein JCM3766R1_005731 [Sporobolomyces carnicolor]